jgi:hypothetical protein
MAIAMTVGATKIKTLHENALASLPKELSPRMKITGDESTPPDSEVCSA